MLYYICNSCGKSKTQKLYESGIEKVNDELAIDVLLQNIRNTHVLTHKIDLTSSVKAKLAKTDKGTIDLDSKRSNALSSSVQPDMEGGFSKRDKKVDEENHSERQLKPSASATDTSNLNAHNASHLEMLPKDQQNAGKRNEDNSNSTSVNAVIKNAKSKPDSPTKGYVNTYGQAINSARSQDSARKRNKANMDASNTKVVTQVDPKTVDYSTPEIIRQMQDKMAGEGINSTQGDGEKK